MDMKEILYAFEESLLDDIVDIHSIKKNNGRYSEQDICNAKYILQSIDYIESIIMKANYDAEGYEYKANYSANSYSSNDGYNRSSSNANYGNNYSRSNSYGRRYGHDKDEFRAEVEKRMNMARNENERAVYANWLNEMDNRR